MGFVSCPHVVFTVGQAGPSSVPCLLLPLDATLYTVQCEAAQSWGGRFGGSAYIFVWVGGRRGFDPGDIWLCPVQVVL